MQTALDILRQCPDEAPLVGFTGSRARTTYDDRHMMLLILEMLRETRFFHPVHGGKPPFDMYLAEACGLLGLVDLFFGDGEPLDYSVRLDPYTVPHDLLDHICLLVAFPRESTKVEEIDPLVEAAPAVGVPVVLIERSGRTSYRYAGAP